MWISIKISDNGKKVQLLETLFKFAYHASIFALALILFLSLSHSRSLTGKSTTFCSALQTAVNFSFENKSIKSCRFKTLLKHFSFFYKSKTFRGRRRRFKNNIKQRMTKERKEALDVFVCVSVKNVICQRVLCVCVWQRETFKARNLNWNIFATKEFTK